MGETKGTRFLKYFPVLLDALRSADPKPMSPPEALAAIRARENVSAEDLMRHVENGSQSIFENDVHWARFYLAKAGLIDNSTRGFWSLTQSGREALLSPDQTWDLYVRIRDASRTSGGAAVDEAEIPAPGVGSDDDDDGRSYWFVGSVWHHDQDQLPRFLEQGVWENNFDEGQLREVVQRIRPGDQIAVKASFVKKQVPFDVGGKPVSVMRIKATGTVVENLGDGLRLKVAWDPPTEPRDWYFYTYRNTAVEAERGSEKSRRLIDFTFRHAPQDYVWWLNQPYWQKKYGAGQSAAAGDAPSLAAAVEDEEAPAAEIPYTIDNIITDGSFVTSDELEKILERWRAKKNLILQGPPGTGKTWLAKRLGFALVGTDDRETVRSRLRVVQFHPSLAYEDFVRGWRPAGDGRLELVDGILMQAIEDAESEADLPFVLVIEEINRGNPAQIFGEMLTLLEATKRHPSEAIELAYRRQPRERVHVPTNLYVIGTMNVADRSLAIVDLALRRRFAFVDLEPQFGDAWRAWCAARGLEESMLSDIGRRIAALNTEIAAAPSLGPQFRIGHSYVTPDSDAPILDGRAWFRARIESEIGPLLDEYWYDAPETARAERAKLLEGITGRTT